MNVASLVVGTVCGEGRVGGVGGGGGAEPFCEVDSFASGLACSPPPSPPSPPLPLCSWSLGSFSVVALGVALGGAYFGHDHVVPFGVGAGGAGLAAAIAHGVTGYFAVSNADTWALDLLRIMLELCRTLL